MQRPNENSSLRARHSWTIGDSRLRVSGNSDVIEYSARIHVKIEEDSAGSGFRPFVQENGSKKWPRTKL
jgi:hypothetical protein